MILCIYVSLIHVQRVFVTCDSSYTAVAYLSHPNPVRPFLCPSVTGMDQSKMVSARITKSSLSTAQKTVVSGSVKFFHKFEGVTLCNGAK